MDRLLITQSLISSWNYRYNCADSCAEKAYDEFIKALQRIERPATSQIQNGIDFENEVYKEAAGLERQPHPKWESGIQAVAEYIRGAPVQIKASRELDIGKYHFLVYGVLDALKAGVIYDVKFCNKRFSSAELAGKYLDSAQHSAYLYMIPEAYKFVYLVSDGQDIYTEEYTRSNTRPIKEIISEFVRDLEINGLMETYVEKWTAREEQECLTNQF